MLLSLFFPFCYFLFTVVRCTLPDCKSSKYLQLNFLSGNPIEVEEEDFKCFFTFPSQYVTHLHTSKQHGPIQAFLVNSSQNLFFDILQVFHHFIQSAISTETTRDQLFNQVTGNPCYKYKPSENCIDEFHKFTKLYLPFTKRVESIGDWMNEVDPNSVHSYRAILLDNAIQIWFSIIRHIVPICYPSNIYLHPHYQSQPNTPDESKKMKGSNGKCKHILLNGNYYSTDSNPKNMLIKILRNPKYYYFPGIDKEKFCFLKEMTIFQHASSNNSIDYSLYNLPKSVVLENNSKSRIIGFIVEYEEGGDLSQFIANPEFGYFQFNRYFFEQLFSLAKELNDLHIAGIYHLDISPSNIFVSQTKKEEEKQDEIQRLEESLQELINSFENIDAFSTDINNNNKELTYKLKWGDFGLANNEGECNSFCQKDSFRKYTRYPREYFIGMEEMDSIGPHSDWYSFGKLLSHLGKEEAYRVGSLKIFSLFHILITGLTDDSIKNRWGWKEISIHFDRILKDFEEETSPTIATSLGVFNQDSYQEKNFIRNGANDQEVRSYGNYFISVIKFIVTKFMPIKNYANFQVDILEIYEYLAEDWITIISEITNGNLRRLRKGDVVVFQKIQPNYSVCFCGTFCKNLSKRGKYCLYKGGIEKVIERIEQRINGLYGLNMPVFSKITQEK